MKKIVIIALTLAIWLPSSAIGSKRSTPNSTKMSYNYGYEVSFVHFIDGLSQWSQYVPSSARDLYNQYFVMTHEDSTMLAAYAANRDKLGWENESNLFAWAANGYSTKQLPAALMKEPGTDTLFKNLKVCIDHFSTKKNQKYSLDSLLHERYSQMQSIIPIFDKYANSISQILEKNRSMYEMWFDKKDINLSNIPVFLCFNHIPTSMQGGSNGDGVYTEIRIENGKDSAALKEAAIVLVHEILHKMIDLKKLAISTIESPAFYKKNAAFFRKNSLTPEELVKKLSSTDKEGMGNSEFSVLEEVVVYYLSNACLSDYSEKDILNKIEQVKKNNRKEYTRIWTGVLYLCREYQKNLKTKQKDAVVAGLIKQFYENVYFENYNPK